MQLTATLLDVGIALLILLSLIIGFVRGFVRELLSLATWVAAFAFALLYLKPLAAQIPIPLQSDIARMGVAFSVIFFGVLVIGAIINYLISAAVSSIGLGGFDKFLGAIFGVLRGGLVVVLLVILFGSFTSYPAEAWWVDSQLLPYFEQAADAGIEWMKGWIPADVSKYL